MNTKYQIINTTESDLEFIHWMLEEAITYQKRNNYSVYSQFLWAVLQKDIKEKRNFKIIFENKIVLVFSLLYADNKLIWREREKGDALYFYRIIVNPDFKGQRLFGELLAWAIHYAKEKKLRFLRMDTWAGNLNLLSYYQSFGFRFIENYTIPDKPDIPIQYRNLCLALLEMDLKNDKIIQ